MFLTAHRACITGIYITLCIIRAMSRLGLVSSECSFNRPNPSLDMALMHKVIYMPVMHALWAVKPLQP